MKHHYEDIRGKIDEEPQWFDEHGVPRYCEFSPKANANIYADEVCLMEIACQGCRARFRVAMSSDGISRVCRGAVSLADNIQDLHYGDPPNIGCCAAGPTMNSEPLRVLQFWKSIDHEWVRKPELEVWIECDWAQRDENECEEGTGK